MRAEIIHIWAATAGEPPTSPAGHTPLSADTYDGAVNELAEQAQGFLMKQLTLAGQAETASTAMTQHDAELGFQLTHVSADGRRGQVELVLGRCEALVTYHAGEDAQQFEVCQGREHGGSKHRDGAILRAVDDVAVDV